MYHELKIWPEPFEAFITGMKKYEVRNTLDRIFKIDDILILREFDPEKDQYTKRAATAYITYITYGGTFGMSKDLCVLGTALIDVYENCGLPMEFGKKYNYQLRGDRGNHKAGEFCLAWREKESYFLFLEFANGDIVELPPSFYLAGIDGPEDEDEECNIQE